MVLWSSSRRCETIQVEGHLRNRKGITLSINVYVQYSLFHSWKCYIISYIQRHHVKTKKHLCFFSQVLHPKSPKSLQASHVRCHHLLHLLHLWHLWHLWHLPSIGSIGSIGSQVSRGPSRPPRPWATSLALGALGRKTRSGRSNGSSRRGLRCGAIYTSLWPLCV